MIRFKFLFAFLAWIAAPLDEQGWALVERPQKNSFEHAGDEDDPSIWVIFSKKLGKENFMVRFPEDPLYSHPSEGEMELASSKEGISYRLHIREAASLEELERRSKEIAMQPGILLIEAKRVAVDTLDLLYQTEGKWVWERLHLTPHHLYVFQTKNEVFQSDGHRYFIKSFNVR